MRFHGFLCLAVLAASRPGAAYVGALTDQGVPLRWDRSCVVFHVNQSASADVPTDKAIDAVQQAFKAWEDVPEAYLRFVFGGITNVTVTGKDKDPHNLVVWREDPSDWTLVPSEVIADTVVTYDVETGVIADADIELNGATFEFTTSPENVLYDIQNAVTHEVGHLLGLDHSPVLGATMNGQALPGELAKRDLAPDDAAGAASLYPTAADPNACDESNVGDWLIKAGAAAKDTSSGSSGCAAGSRTSKGVACAAWALLALLFLRRRAWLAPWLLILFVAVPAQGYVVYKAPSGEPLRWRTSDATVLFDTAKPEDVDEATARSQIEASYKAWSAISCDGSATPFSFDFAGEVADTAVGYVENGTNENLVVWVQSGWSHGGTVLALTSLTYDVQTGEIVDGDLELNDEDYTYSTSAAKNAVDLKNTVVHESGHFLGLDHSKVAAATMYDKAPLGEVVKRDLHADDIAGFCALYGPNAPDWLVVPQSTGHSSGGTCAAGGQGAQAGPVGLACLAVLLLLRGAAPARRRCPRTRPPCEAR